VVTIDGKTLSIGQVWVTHPKATAINGDDAIKALDAGAAVDCAVDFRPRCYEWVVEGDIKACFDEISHPALMDRVRRRVGDKRVLELVKAFLKAGILTEDRQLEDTTAGTPQGGLCAAAHKDPYEQRRVMRSAGRQGLVTAVLGVDHCA